jgi:lipopolysaccharide/colanic/teichoic acid biosynthesis glycosyltransferase
VLLPDTPAVGARVFVDKLCDEVAGKSPRPQSVIYTYPGGAAGGQDGRKDNGAGDPDGGRGGGRGPSGGRGPAPAGGRSRIFGSGDFGWGGFGGHNYVTPGGAVAFDPAGDPIGTTVLASAQPSRATKAVTKPSAAPRLAEEDETLAPAGSVQPLHALLVRRMPAWKRAIDLVGAAVGLFILAPLFAAVALAIKFTSPGPVVFTQKRSGLGGRTFTIYKFRTMCADAEARKQALRKLSEQDGPAFKLTHDPRVTRVGRLLRKTSVDELPQLWNVLKGDMSLVGPRPLPVDEAAGCEGWQKRRLDVTPGLTCIWQIEGRSEVSFAEWVRMDVKYMRRLTLLHDLSILFKTVPAVLLRRGAR